MIGLFLAQSASRAPSGTAGAVLWVGLGIVVVIVLSLLVLRVRRWLLGDASSENAALSLADTLRELRARGEISAADFARAQERMLGPRRAAPRPERGGGPPRRGGMGKAGPGPRT